MRVAHFTNIKDAIPFGQATSFPLMSYPTAKTRLLLSYNNRLKCCVRNDSRNDAAVVSQSSCDPRNCSPNDPTVRLQTVFGLRSKQSEGGLCHRLWNCLTIYPGDNHL